MTVPAFRYGGVIPILVTPFHDDETLDLDSLRRLIRFLTGLKVDALTLLGVMARRTAWPTANGKRCWRWRRRK
jgi:dihydrodipicolinate synthase/N-acetylneuraminate lyase